jgi:Domain of unknown function (DUF4386)
MSPKRNEARPPSATGIVPDRAGQGLFAPTPAEQRTARIMGAWFLGTFIAIPAFFFYDPILNHADYVIGSGDDIRVAVGALLEILLAIAGIATAVVIFPIVKRVNESVALGYIASRTVESVLILVGVVSLMSIVSLRQDLADTLGDSGASIDVAVDCSPYMTKPPFSGAGLGNGILLGYLRAHTSQRLTSPELSRLRPRDSKLATRNA